MKITEALLAEHVVFHNLFDHVERTARGLAGLGQLFADGCADTTHSPRDQSNASALVCLLGVFGEQAPQVLFLELNPWQVHEREYKSE